MEKLFTVTDDHLKLLKRLNFRYDSHSEFGAPIVDPKRPYGNSDVYIDMGEILDISPDLIDSWGDPKFSVEQERYFDKVHEEMVTVLEILTRNLSISKGEYRAEEYRSNWTRNAHS